MAIRLLVRSEFLNHACGDRITDPAEVKAVLRTHPDFVLRETVPTDREAMQEAAAVKPLHVKGAAAKG